LGIRKEIIVGCVSRKDVSMENEYQEVNKNKAVAKILVPLLIVLVIVGIWFIKDLQRNSDGDDQANGNPDFALKATEPLDLEQLKSYGIPIILDFGSESCPPCREMAPTIEKLNKDLQGKAIIKYMDVWESPELAEGYPISVIPTLMFFDKDGNPYLPPDPETTQMILYSTKDTEEHVFTAQEGIMTEDKIRAILVEMGMEE